MSVHVKLLFARQHIREREQPIVQYLYERYHGYYNY